MKLLTVGTGSAGNCYLLQLNDDSYIALDCGVAWKKVMIVTKFRPSDIRFALVTHNHSDHSCYERDFRRNGIDTYNVDNLIVRKIFKKGDVEIIPFEVPHDVRCYGYLIRVDGRNIVYMTDFGYCQYTFKSWNIDTWIIACNHIAPPNIDEMKYAHVVWGHSSLATVKDIIQINKCDAMKNIILCHYSEDADTDLMIKEIQEIAGDGVNVTLAEKGKVITL
jgi:ribonuclease BN (tRNA processing enzyme)